jgi:UDP-2-acetamido-2-deoxy-ribo-hexuluronate aminotransferase
VEFIDLHAQQNRIRETIEARIRTVLDHGQYIMGPEIKELESKLTAYVGVKHALGCASGTDALLMALMALGTGPGDAIFTSPFTFIATAEVICLLGATPIFVDIDPKTFNIDPENLEKAIIALKNNDKSLYPLPLTPPVVGSYRHSSHLTSRPLTPPPSHLTPKAIIPVDLFGLTADYDAIQAVTDKYDLAVIEDAAQSFGAEFKGKRACSFGNIACTSFFPAKPLGCYGDGGMCFTNNDGFADVMDSIRVHGKGNHKYDNVRVGINGRLDSLQAAILIAKFDIFPEEIELRQKVAAGYSRGLGEESKVIPPQIPVGYKSSWAQYSVLARDESHRSQLQSRLKKAGIPTAIYYPKPLHLQTAFSYLGYRQGDFPVSEDCASRIFSLPMHPYLRSEDQDKIVRLLHS